MTADSAWNQEDPDLVRWLEQHRVNTLKAYAADRLLLGEHANQEDSYRTGGYSRRQILELVQNAADAQHENRRGRIEIRLVGETLYCANEGKAFSRGGLEAICHAFLSDKRDEAIGRFGLGFKSVLGITGNPAVFSRSISFGFDAERAATEFRRLDPTATRFPVLRMPAHLDVMEEIQRDTVLADLAEWATTVIRLPLTADAARLERELKDFPLEFLLFVPRASTLRIVVDRPENERVELEHECIALPDGVRRLQTKGRAPSDWRVWQGIHRPSPQALQEVGEAIRRESVKVTWAAPLASDLSTLGRFWAYYPLTETTSLRGILNAPWQINDDRTSLLRGKFNQEILERISALVVQGLPDLGDPADPARHFDYLPARGREAPNFADRFLTERVPQLVAADACIPDRDGVLRRVDELRFPHQEQVRLDAALLNAWYSAPGGPRSVPHIQCFRNTTRQARLRSLIRADDTRAASVELPAPAWLEQVVGNATDKECASALQVVAATKDQDTRHRFLSARILPDDSGRLWPLSATGDVFLRGDALTSQARISLVRQSLLALPDVEPLLHEFGFQDVNPADELAKLTRADTKKWANAEWAEFWRLVSDVPKSLAEQHLEDHLAKGRRLKVRCRDGWWHYSDEVVIAGKVRPQSPVMVLDEDFHHDLHPDLLRRIGIAAEPVVSRALAQDSTYLEYLRRIRTTYLSKLPARGRPSDKELGFLDHDPVGPLHILRRFRDSGDVESCMGWTDALLKLDVPDKWMFGRVARKTLSPIEVLAPSVWAAREYGLLATSWGPRPATGSVARTLLAYAPFLPVAEWQAADKLPLTESLADIAPGIWQEFLGRVPSIGDAWTLGGLVAEAARTLPESEVPEYVPAISGSSGCRVPREELLIARTEEENLALAQRRSAYVVVSDSALATLLIDKWGCTLASSRLRVEVLAENPAEPVVVLDRYRGLRPLAEGALHNVDLVECGDLFRQITGPEGVDREPADLLRDGNVVYHRAALQDEDLLTRLANEFRIELNTNAIARILEDSQDEAVQTRIAMCRKERNHPRKLLHLLDVEKLEARLPTGLLDTVRKLDDDEGTYQVAQLLVDVHGYDVLRELRHDLKAAGFPVPDRWAGSPPAVGFVRSLGFPTEYAGERGSHLEPDLTVLGPPRLGPLHPYQQELAEKIRRLVADRGRGLLFLPTGAGKTRVTVQALATAFIEDGLTGHLLWVAQSEELCEQAVQTWSTAWRDIGDGRALRICRLWDRNEIAEGENELMVVVATDAKLTGCRDDPDYTWLAKPAVVVIDEAHEATGKDYRKLLAWLGLDTRRTTRPLLGLTATPFKGTNEEMTRRLVGRFGGNLLDVLGDDPYGRLQELGVLSRVKHQVLDGGAVILDAEEAETTQRTRLLPSSVLERLGRDEARTLRLLEHIAGLPPEWPVLVFTASVLSAQVLAALLRVRKIPAASISGYTRIHERRRSIERFRGGEIRVLTNCNVLTQGFDVPGVRALYIARPTFSPNAYIQMVGRGLRGPANGGKAECLVVNVADTFGQFGERLAFREFDHLWERQGGRDT
ncbi:superfamily II DNA or RNA helicase [Kibdelosporangium banguiense]|uniref:Superfamily II DNA or RNA helicase n=1 Tax=Kibdelosporangium banguiense TaxID=1365924 RepID=A0ABS4TF34_9PSEU|nr:DEAD/DEAH box helicase family protein [Kibdelosporangium banguiense]MBP2323043.1 superfamily II DNA or RNA helicase [Kibdelosporangium banguiense]